jgi:hypothetical protein
MDCHAISWLAMTNIINWVPAFAGMQKEEAGNDKEKRCRKMTTLRS